MNTKIIETKGKPSMLKSALDIGWAGQMVASGCWIASVFVYGISSLGDVLQLAAATAWMIANIAALWETHKDVSG